MAELDEVAAQPGRALDFAKVRSREKGEVLAAFAAHKKDVTIGSWRSDNVGHAELTFAYRPLTELAAMRQSSPFFCTPHSGVRMRRPAAQD